MAEDDSSGWNLTESDPSVFSELLKTLGVPLIVDDLYSLDTESLAALQPIHALIFLFKWLPSSSATNASSTTGNYDPEFPGFFAHQVVNNACATLAVLNALGNITPLTAGPQLNDLFSFTNGMDPQTRGLAITSSDWLREAHNSLSPPSAISLDGLGLSRKSEDAYHFVVYLPFMGSVYELDGLKEYPVTHGPYVEGGEGWVKRAREAIENRISMYPDGAIEFSLLALRDDPLPQLQAHLAQCQSSHNHADVGEILAKIATENNKRERWAFENSLRRHNHFGLVHALVSALAKAGTLEPAKEKARTLMTERIAKAKGEIMEED